MLDIEDSLIRESAKGDLDAFEEIYKIASPYVYTIVYQITNNVEDAQDVTQDVFIKVHNNVASFKFKSSFKTWIYKIAVNTALNTIKKRAREEDKITNYEKEIKYSSKGNDNEEITNYENQNLLIESLAENLNPDQRACILLREIEGMSYKEIAKTLNININTVRSRLKRARLILMAAYKRSNV